MANPDHLMILKQGVGIWNAWREENIHLVPNLNYHHFLDARGNSTANFQGINFNDCCLVDANLAGANLRDAQLSGADLRICNLRQADLSRANLSMANMSLARLDGAIFKDSIMYRTNLSTAYLNGADITGAYFNLTILSGLDLSGVKGLSNIEHSGPSFMDIETIVYNRDNLPESFLKELGISDAIIQHIRTLTVKAIEYYTCFISHSSNDKDFAGRLHSDLINKGVRCYYAPVDMKSGKMIHQQLDEAIRYHDKLLLVLSKYSLASDWVANEIKWARKREKESGKQKLFPITLVPYKELEGWNLFDSDTATDLAAEVRSYHIADFTQWRSHNAYKRAFERLLEDLKPDS